MVLEDNHQDIYYLKKVNKCIIEFRFTIKTQIKLIIKFKRREFSNKRKKAGCANPLKAYYKDRCPFHILSYYFE